MKGLSLILTFALLVLAHELAARLKTAEALPSQKESAAGLARALSGRAEAGPVEASPRTSAGSRSARSFVDETTFSM